MDFISNLCSPAQTFVIIAVLDVILISLFPNKERSLLLRVKLFILAIILVIGWTVVVNSSCDSIDNYLAWALVMIPAFYMLFRWKK